MLDFRKELEKYDFAAIDTGFAGIFSERTQMMEQFNSALKRIDKKLDHAALQLEEVLAEYMDGQEKDKQIAELRKAAAAGQEEMFALVRGLVAVLDQLEDLYRYALKNEAGPWYTQMQLLWQNIAAGLLLQGVTRIEGENTFFDARIHSAVEVQEDDSLPGGMITEVLRAGYSYQGRLLRKAQVIVNKTSGGEENGE